MQAEVGGVLMFPVQHRLLWSNVNILLDAILSRRPFKPRKPLGSTCVHALRTILRLLRRQGSALAAEILSDGPGTWFACRPGTLRQARAQDDARSIVPFDVWIDLLILQSHVDIIRGIAGSSSLRHGHAHPAWPPLPRLLRALRPPPTRALQRHRVDITQGQYREIKVLRGDSHTDFVVDSCTHGILGQSGVGARPDPDGSVRQRHVSGSTSGGGIVCHSWLLDGQQDVAYTQAIMLGKDVDVDWEKVDKVLLEPLV